MKKLICTIILAFSLQFTFAQTEAQKTLVNNFFNHSGGNALQDAAHPACTWSHAEIKSYGDHTYYITLHYTQVLTSKEFSCEYRIRLDALGRFISTAGTDCNSTNFPCFMVCRLADLTEITTADDRARYERYVGKNLENMTCEEYINVKLFFLWSDYGYYKKY
jgi:hypothetical protein